MNDVFKEQLVSRKSGKQDLLKKVGLIAAGVLLVLIGMFIPILASFFLPIVVIVVIGEIFLLNKFNIEYEYIFTNGDLDIDRITNKSKRKRALSVNVKKFITMVPANNPAYEREVSNFTKLMDVSSGEVNERTYIAIYEQDSARTKLIFEPNEQLFEAIKNYIPRIIKK